MPLTLHYHPLSSYSMKVVMAFYETATPFTPRTVNLADPEGRAAFLELTPLGKMPVLVDADRKETVVESTIILEYLALRGLGGDLIPKDPEQALHVRALDRF